MSLSTARVVGVELLVLARRALARPTRLDVTRQGGTVPPSDTGERRHGPDPDTEVVVPAPDPQVVASAELAVAVTAEVRRLVPAVARPGQHRHDLPEVALHRLRLASELLTVRMREPRSWLRLELVARQVFGLERQGVREVRVELGGALAGDPVDEIERDVVETGITESLHCAPDVVGTGNALQHFEQVRPKRLRAEGDAVHPMLAEQGCEGRRHGLRVGLDRQLLDVRERAEHARERGRARERRRPAAEERGLDLCGEPPALPLELGQERVDVRTVLVEAPYRRHEVAVAAAMRAEGQVDIEMTDGARLAPCADRARGRLEQPDAHAFRFSPSRFSTARNASCGTSTPATCFIRFFPFFCFSSSLRFRVMSPP